MTNNAKDMMIRRNLADDMPMMEDYINSTHPSLPAHRMAFADYLLNWEAAKERDDLFTLFGDKLIISKKIEYQKNFDELCEEFDRVGARELVWKMNENIVKIGELMFKREFSYDDSVGVMYRCDEYYTNRMSRTANHVYLHDTGWGFTSSDDYMKLMANPVAHNLFDIFGIMGIMANEVKVWVDNKANWPKNRNTHEHDHPFVILPNTTKKFRINQDQKPIRVYSTFSTYLRDWAKNCCTWETPGKYEMELMLDSLDVIIEDVRQAMSMVLNQADCHGELCVSIHPLDYMTMSDEGNGWTSCMQWVEQDGGEYHAGTLEMMTSPCVIVAYLKGKDDILIGSENYTWNKKKWRELFIVDHNFISGIKGYPYCNESLEDAVFGILNDLAKKNWNNSYNVDVVQTNQDNLIWVNDHYISCETNFMYNDYQYTDCRLIANVNENVFVDRYRRGVEIEAESYFYGEQCFCLVCGKPRDINEEEGSEFSLACRSCDHKVKCSECGCWNHEDEMITLSDGRRICESCADSLSRCDSCKDIVEDADQENWVGFQYMHHTGLTYSKVICLCDKCFEKYYKAGMIDENGKITKMDDELASAVRDKYFFPLASNEYRLYNIEWVGKEGEEPDIFSF